MPANPHEATNRTLKALELERVLVDAGCDSTVLPRLGPPARELAEREVHARRMAIRPVHKRRPFTDADRGSEATWATVATLMAAHEQAAASADDRVSLGQPS